MSTVDTVAPLLRGDRLLDAGVFGPIPPLGTDNTIHHQHFFFSVCPAKHVLAKSSESIEQTLRDRGVTEPRPSSSGCAGVRHGGLALRRPGARLRPRSPVPSVAFRAAFVAPLLSPDGRTIEAIARSHHTGDRPTADNLPRLDDGRASDGRWAPWRCGDAHL